MENPMTLEQILDDVKLAAQYKLAILTDGATDETVRGSAEFASLSEDDYNVVRAQALGPIYATAVANGVNSADIEAYCYGKGIAKSVVDAVAANGNLSSKLGGAS
jgi:hypothetical protein